MDKLILICVDDQREVLASVARDLKCLTAWVRLEECESSAEALDLLDDLDAEGAPVALVVCDHLMPGGNGVDFLAELAADRRFLKVKKLLLTGQATHKDTIDAVNRARIDHYLEKPWQADTLQGICRRLLSEYLFDIGAYTEAHRTLVDPEVLLLRLQGSE